MALPILSLFSSVVNLHSGDPCKFFFSIYSRVVSVWVFYLFFEITGSRIQESGSQKLPPTAQEKCHNTEYDLCMPIAAKVALRTCEEICLKNNRKVGTRNKVP